MIPVQPAPFPDHNIDPKLKGKDFILAMAKACEYNWNTTIRPGIFRAKADVYNEIRDYAFNRQSVEKYQKALLPEDDKDEHFQKISWATHGDGMVLRNIAVAKVEQAIYNIICRPISQNAQDAQDQYYAEQFAKILVSKSVKQNQLQTDHPIVQQNSDGPRSIEDLQTELRFSPKFNRAKDAEIAIALIRNENNYKVLIRQLAEDIVDFGCVVVKDDLNSSNKVKYEYVYPGDFACSKCEKPDFSDMTWAFTIKSVKLTELAKHFNADDMEKIKNRIADANPHLSISDTNGVDVFKADVMDLEFISWDRRVTETNLDRNGNPRTSFTDPANASKNIDGKEFVPKTIENLYKCKWVVGTDLIYDYGKATDMKRDMAIETMSKCQMSFHVAATNFHNMCSTGLTENLMSIIDDLNNTTFKIRMFKAIMVPNGFDIDIAALESIPWGAGGKKLSIKQVVNMFFETGVLLNRRSGPKFNGNNFSNYKAINAVTNGQAEQLIALFKDHQENKQALRDAVGMNELTDGSSPNPKLLTTVANLANEATNNALWPYMQLKQTIEQKLASGTIKRCQTALLKGPYDGYDPKNKRFITVSNSLLDFDYDIILEAEASDEQKQQVYNLVAEDIKTGVLNSLDYIYIINTYNLKDAQEILAKKIEANKAQMQAFELQKSQVAALSSGKIALSTENAKMQNDIIRHRMALETTTLEKVWDYLIQKEKNKQLDAIADKKADTEIMKAGIGMGNPNSSSQLPGGQGPGQQPGQPGQPGQQPGQLDAAPEQQQPEMSDATQ